jgi:hypothetical protein
VSAPISLAELDRELARRARFDVVFPPRTSERDRRAFLAIPWVEDGTRWGFDAEGRGVQQPAFRAAREGFWSRLWFVKHTRITPEQLKLAAWYRKLGGREPHFLS